MRTFIGTGKGTPQAAVKQALQGLVAPKAILFVASYQLAEEAAKLIHNAYPEIPSIGTIGNKLIQGQIGEDNLAVLAFFDDTRVRCGLIQEINRCPVACVGEIQQKLSEISADSKDTVCIEYCTGSEEKLVTTFQACFGQRKISMIGGTVDGRPDGKPTSVAYNGVLYENSCVYAFIKNLTGSVKVYKENIYVKRSNQAHFATKVDISRKALIELDGKPAAEVYSKEIGIEKNKIADNVFVNPMGRVVGEQVFISSMKEIKSDGTLLNFKRINKNDCIYFLNLGDYKEIERKTREKIKRETPRISLILSMDCAYRYAMYTQNGFIAEYAREMATLGTHFGVIAAGEQYNNQHANQTMVCAVFE